MMLEGKYGKAYLTIDDVEDECIRQIYSFLNHLAFTNHVTMMPDMHTGNAAAIGFTMLMTDKIIPNVIGVDIACGILSLGVDIGNGELSDGLYNDTPDWETIDYIIRDAVPLGFNVHSSPVATIEKNFPWQEANEEAITFFKKFDAMFDTKASEDFEGFDYKNYLDSCKSKNINPAQVDSSIGTLGGGNHFIEMGKDIEGEYWLTIHSGSRNFGLKIANYWQKQAQALPVNTINNRDLAYLTYPYNTQYLTDMIFVQHFAKLNRKTMGQRISDAAGFRFMDNVESVHNYIDFHDMIIRKGAIRSYENERLIIPFNMRDGILMCWGKSNPEWNYSAPHGAGRIMGRKQAKRVLKLEDFKNQMNGIYSTCINEGTLDEAPDSYKSSEMIERAIGPTAMVINKIKPLYNLKG
jgi:RNA-splicing ligase RtcB